MAAEPQTTPTNTSSTNTQKRPALPPSTSSTTAQTTSKTPVTLHPTSHLDPSAYVRGQNAMQIGSNVLIHPRTHLLSIHAPLSINSGSIIAEKSVIGGPIPSTSTTGTGTGTGTVAETDAVPEAGSRATEIGRDVHVHPNVVVNSGARVGDYVVLESNVVVGHGVVVGEHSKVCAGVDLTRDVPGWMVVYGMNGEFRRRRKVIDSGDAGGDGVSGSADQIERARLSVMSKERESTMALLKKAAARNIASKSRR